MEAGKDFLTQPLLMSVATGLEELALSHGHHWPSFYSQPWGAHGSARWDKERVK